MYFIYNIFQVKMPYPSDKLVDMFVHLNILKVVSKTHTDLTEARYCPAHRTLNPPFRLQLSSSNSLR